MTSFLRMSLGSERYGIDVAHVHEVTALDAVTPVPGAGPHIAGIRHLHGTIVPVVRISDLLRAPRGDPRTHVVVEYGDRLVGLCVDAAEEVEELPEPTGSGAPLTSGAVLHDGCTIGILDVGALLDAVSASVR